MGLFSSSASNNGFTIGDSTTTSSPDPFLLNHGRINYEQLAQAIDSLKFVPRRGPVGFNADQTQYQNLVRGWGTPNAQGYMGSANTQKNAGLSFDLLNNASKAVALGPQKVGTYLTSDQRLAELLDPINNYKYKTSAEIVGPMQELANRGDIRDVLAGKMDAASVNRNDIRNVLAGTMDAASVNRGDIRDVTTANTYDELNKYLSMIDPQYANAVLNPALSDIERNRQMVQQQNAAGAARAGAFGGSRHGVADSETNRAYADQVAKTTGDLRMNMFDKAMSSLQADLGRRLQASGMNQQTDLGVASQNANLTQAARQANLDAYMQAQGLNQQADVTAATKNADLLQGSRQSNLDAYMKAQGMNQSADQAVLGMKDAARANYAKMLADAGLANESTRSTLARDRAKYAFDTENLNNDKRTAADKTNAQLYNDWIKQQESLSSTANTNADSAAVRDAAFAKLLAESGNAQQKQSQSESDTQQANDDYAAWFDIIKGFLKQQALGQTPGTTSNFTTGSTNTSGNSSASPSMAETIAKIVGGLISSDKRLKSDVNPIDKPLSKLRKLNGVTYSWKATGAPDAGLLAQDVQSAMPGAATTFGGTLHYSMPQVIGLLTESVKELDRKVKGAKR